MISDPRLALGLDGRGEVMRGAERSLDRSYFHIELTFGKEAVTRVSRQYVDIPSSTF